MKQAVSISFITLILLGCNPTVRVETPTEPIRIELTATIKHEIVVKVQKDVEEILDDEDLF